MSELKPCPFCRNEYPMITETSMGVQITCPVCQTKFRCDCTASHDYSKAETVKRWNRRAKPANDPLTLDQLREMDDPSPIWKEEPPSGDMTESGAEPVLFNGVHQRGKEEIVCWVTCEAHHANARVEHIAAGKINFYLRPPERSTDGKT